jgi:hypothetical protein
MKRAAVLLGLAALLATAHVVLAALGAADHTSVIAGMPLSPASWTLGPLYVVVHLATVIALPILVLAAALEAAVETRARARVARA